MSPARNAPIIEPGKASNVPLPIIFLMREVTKAENTAYFVPTNVARNILIMCCRGNARAKPSGNENIGESTTHSAVSNAEKINFFKDIELFCIFTSVAIILYTIFGDIMNKNEVYKFLDLKNVYYEVTEHEEASTMEELSMLDLPYKNSYAKNLFVRDNGKKHYYLITVYGNKNVDLKKFREFYGTKRLGFASQNDLMKILKLKAGAVTPLGLLNDDLNIVEFYIDEDLISSNKLIGFPPNDNCATIWIKCTDLVNILKECGKIVHTFKI